MLDLAGRGSMDPAAMLGNRIANLDDRIAKLEARVKILEDQLKDTRGPQREPHDRR